MKSKVSLLAYIYRFFLLLISYITIRSSKKWVVGSNLGFSNNSKYFFIYLCNTKKDINIIWIGEKDDIGRIKNGGYKAYYRWSLIGLWHSLTAGVYVYASYIADINLYTFGRARKVNLWHGVGIKNIEFKVSTGRLKSLKNKSLLNKIKYFNHFVKPDIFLSTSPLMTNHFSECFQIPKSKCVEATYPRCDIFSWDKDELKKMVETFETEDTIRLFADISHFEKVFLYMPTWRDSGANFFEYLQFDFTRLDALLQKHNQLFILKLHPATKISVDLSGFSNIRLFSTTADIYPFLPFVDFLITDYSSIYYDFLLLKNKRTIFFYS